VSIYLDHNATSPLRPEAREAFADALDRCRGNASSLHAAGRAARAMIDDARERVAAALGVHEDEVLFTSSATEANNLALFGTLAARTAATIVASPIEHPSLLAPLDMLHSRGHALRHLAVDRAGCIDPEELLATARDADVVVLSAANNEVGSRAPLDAWGATYAAGSGAVLVSDCVQALGRVELTLDQWGVDLASFSCHKAGGPLGCGVLVRRKGVPLAGQLHGGGQESALRPGTENVPAIVGGAVAIEAAVREQAAFAQQAARQSQLLWTELKRSLPEAELLGPAFGSELRLPNTVTILLPHIDGRVLVTRLDLAGLQVGAGSACSSGSLEPSHVLQAMGFDGERARAGVRLSLGPTTSDEDIHSAVDILRKTLRAERKS